MLTYFRSHGCPFSGGIGSGGAGGAGGGAGGAGGAGGGVWGGNPLAGARMHSAQPYIGPEIMVAVL